MKIDIGSPEIKHETLTCDRCGYENTKEFIKYFDYCENCGLNMKQTCDKRVLCPVLGQTYNYFDDGKIKKIRRMEVVITEIIPFNKIDEETLNDWKQEVEECHWLYAKETDFFVKADLKVSNDKIEKIIFVRTINNNNGWFSLGWWGGRLDIDGSLNDALLNRV
jgi:hypothetical protein